MVPKSWYVVAARYVSNIYFAPILHTQQQVPDRAHEPGHTNTNPPRVARARGRVRPPAFTLLISLYITSDHPYLRVCYDRVYVCSLSLLIKRDF